MPESWAHVTINGDSVSVQVDENPETKRIGYLVIKSGKYKERITISQEGKSATHLSVSNENVSFSYSGGSRAITVSTDGKWHISTETAGWGHTSISGNNITLRIDENSSSSPRNSFFVIKSGSLEQ